MASDGLPYKITSNGWYDGTTKYYGNCEDYAKSRPNKTDSDLGFVKYPGRTYLIAEYRPYGDYYHYMRKNEDGTWSQRIGNYITNYIFVNGQPKQPLTKITTANLTEAFEYAGYGAPTIKSFTAQ